MRVLAMAGAVAGVGVAGVALADSPEGAARSAAGCQPRAGFGSKVGKVLKLRGDVFQGPSKVDEKTALRKNATLCAISGRAGGTLKFEIVQVKKTQCEMRPGARLRLYPRDANGVVIQFEAGTTRCATREKKKKKVKYRVEKNGPTLVMDDPLFGIVAGARKSVVKVKLGVVQVKARTGDPVIVGPNQQTTVPPKGPAQEPVPIRETPEDKKAFGELKAAVPKPDLSRPDASGSAALQRIFANGYIAAGVVSDVPRDAGSSAFLLDFFNFLATSWRIALHRLEEPTSEFAKKLATHELDIAVTSMPKSFKGFDAMPLFADAKDVTWYVVFERDAGLSQALRSYVRASVNGGQYSAFYRNAYGKEPSLDILQPILLGG